MRKRFVLGWVTAAIFTLTAFADTPNSAYVVTSMNPGIHQLNLDTGEIIFDLFPIGNIPNAVRINKNRGYIVNSGDNDITVFDLQSNTVITAVSLSGSNAWDIAFEGNDRAFVSHWDSDNVSVIDLETLAETDVISCGPYPEGVLVFDNRLYVTCVDYDPVTWGYGPGRVEIYDLATLTLENTIWTNTVNPQSVALDSLNRLHVVCTGDYWSVWGSIEVYDLNTLNLELEIPIGGSPASFAVTPNGTAFLGAGGWFSDGYVYTYNTITGEILHGETNPILVGTGVIGVDVSKQDHGFACSLYGNVLTEIDADGTILTTYDISGGPQVVGIYDRPELTVSLDPVGSPIVIPPGGGSFDFTVQLSNTGNFPVQVDIWFEATTPLGTVVPVLTRENVALNGGETSERSMTQYVPGRAPMGSYEYRVIVGYADTGEILSSEMLTFEKSGMDESPGDWSLAGFNPSESGFKAPVAPVDFAVNVYPNPFNPVTVIRFDLAESGWVKLSVFDLQGRLVETLIQGNLARGIHRVDFKAADLPSGVYLYRLETTGGSSSGRLLLLK
jgi:YVTN family beta-propeller protein